MVKMFKDQTKQTTLDSLSAKAMDSITDATYAGWVHSRREVISQNHLKDLSYFDHVHKIFSCVMKLDMPVG